MCVVFFFEGGGGAAGEGSHFSNGYLCWMYCLCVCVWGGGGGGVLGFTPLKRLP